MFGKRMLKIIFGYKRKKVMSRYTSVGIKRGSIPGRGRGFSVPQLPDPTSYPTDTGGPFTTP
jgi:hypothetical protein